MPEPASIQVSGNVEGSIVVGDHNFVVNNNHGTIIYQQSKPQVLARQYVSQPPRAPRGFINRSAELTKLEGWIAGNEIVLLYGPDGMGKSALLRQAANSAAAKAMPGGVILLESVDLDGQALGPDDIIQRLFDTLFESNPPLKVDAASARPYLSNTRPLILMDEVGLAPALQRALPDLFPQGSILLAADAPFGADSQRLSIGPLPKVEALALLATRAELTLNDLNRAALEQICALLGNVSLALVITGNILRETHTSPEAALQAIEAIQTPERDPALAALSRSFGFAFSRLSPAQQQVLSAAALTPGVSMTPEWLSTALGGADVSEVIEQLKALGLLFTNSPRLRLPPGFAIPARRAAVLDEQTVLPRLIEFLRSRGNPQDEFGNIFGAIVWAAKEGRTADVIALGRALDPYLTLNGLWDSWQIILDYILEAARQSGQQSIEAWALHQLGTRAIGAGTPQQAVLLLRQALTLRQKLGDASGAAYTQHNLNLLIGAPAQPRDTLQSKKSAKPARTSPNWFLLAGGIALVALFLLSGLVVVGLRILYPPPIVVTPIITPTSTEQTPLTETMEPPTELAPSTLTPPPSFTPTAMPRWLIDLRDVNRQNSDMPFLYQGNDEDDYFEIPVIVSITSQGQIALDHSNMSIRFNDAELAAFRLDGENSFQTTKDVKIASPITIYIKVSKKYQGTTATLQTELEACGQDVDCQSSRLDIQVPSVVYDFVDQAENATWIGYDPTTEKTYDLPFNGPKTDQQGIVQLASFQELEDGSIPGYVLFTHPTWFSNINQGQIMGRYGLLKEIPLQSGDRLVVRVGFIKVDGGIDGVTFHLGFVPNVRAAPAQDLFLVKDDGADGKLKDQSILLPDGVVAGNFSYFYLKVDAGNTTNSDWAAWVSAYIARP